MYDKWQVEIDEACAEIAQLDDDIRLEVLTEGWTERVQSMQERRNELYNTIAITVYVDWKFRR